MIVRFAAHTAFVLIYIRYRADWNRRVCERSEGAVGICVWLISSCGRFEVQIDVLLVRWKGFPIVKKPNYQMKKYCRGASRTTIRWSTRARSQDFTTWTYDKRTETNFAKHWEWLSDVKQSLVCNHEHIRFLVEYKPFFKNVWTLFSTIECYLVLLRIATSSIKPLWWNTSELNTVTEWS